MELNPKPTPLVSDCLSADLWELLSLGSDEEPLCREEGAALIEAGSPHTPLLLVEAGQVEINTATGGRVTLEAPTVVGEQSLLSGRPTNATVLAGGTVRVREVQPERFWELVRTDPSGTDLLQGLTNLNIDRLKGKFHPEPYIALIAHDDRKGDLIKVAGEFLPYLQKQSLLSTEHTAQRLQGELNLTAGRVVRSGPRGGDQEVGTLVVEGLVKAVFFFPDPLTSQPHFMDVGALQRVCDVCHVPIATNRGSAIHLFTSLCSDIER